MSGFVCRFWYTLRMPEGLEGDGLGEADALRVVRMGGRYICGSSIGGSVSDMVLSPICTPHAEVRE